MEGGNGLIKRFGEAVAHMSSRTNAHIGGDKKKNPARQQENETRYVI